MLFNVHIHQLPRGVVASIETFSLEADTATFRRLLTNVKQTLEAT
jgi:hypothetical protein